MDPERPMRAVGDGAFLADLPAGAIDTVLALATPASTRRCRASRSDTSAAPSREAPGAGAQPRIDAKYLMFAGGFPPHPNSSTRRAPA